MSASAIHRRSFLVPPRLAHFRPRPAVCRRGWLWRPTWGADIHSRRAGHFPAKAERLIVVFLTGGFSQVDTFDPKPQLSSDAGREFRDGVLLASPFKFHRGGRSGLAVSELFPHLGQVADELCVLRTLHTDIVEHFQATLAMHTGSATVPMPSLGAWVSYALGTHNGNLPSYMVLAEHLPYAGAGLGQQLPAAPLSGRAHHSRRRANSRSTRRPTSASGWPSSSSSCCVT